jgi:uncharacterized protein YbbC (DUF1343 family)
MKLGLENLVQNNFNLLKGKRIGLLAHQASVDSQGTHALDLLKNAGANITTLFGPEHGIKGSAQDMEPVLSDETSSIPAYSLYGDSFESLSPTPAMLENIDVLVIDLQDIGSRYYTYIWTTALCMKACAKAGKKVIVCDRPNPLGGLTVEGMLQKKGYESFVGLYQLPVRHGMTIGEISTYVNDSYSLGCDLEVVPMEGWSRDQLWPDTGLKWVNPSPNMRSFEAALLYPGMCLIEGTNISEGRGTETPFEVIGAPFIDAQEFVDAFSTLKPYGIEAQHASFMPTVQKHVGKTCQGIRWKITKVGKFQAYRTGLAVVWLINQLYKGTGFEWRTQAYEFVDDIPAIDLLTGSDFFRTHIDGDLKEVTALADSNDAFKPIRRKYLMY